MLDTLPGELEPRVYSALPSEKIEKLEPWDGGIRRAQGGILHE